MRGLAVGALAAMLATAAAAQALGNWHDASDRDPMTDAVSTGAQTDAAEGHLFVGCLHSRPSVGFLTNRYLGELDQRETDYRIDGGSPVKVMWTSNSHITFVQDAEALALARRIQSAKTVVIRTYTFDEESITATFDVTGAAAAVPHGLGPCGA
jgi:hypothetical protein